MEEGDGFWDSIWGGIGDGWNYLTDPDSALGFEEIMQLLGAYGGYKGWFNSDQEKVGYQGKIPDLTAVREEVPINWDAYYEENQRRPGEYGQRYFTDTSYATTPEEMMEPPTLAEAQAAAAQQKQQLIAQNTARGADSTYTPQFAKGGIVDAMNTLKGGGMQNRPQRPPMPPQAQSQAVRPPMPPQVQRPVTPMPPPPQGIASQYQRGPGDGMSDSIPANIEGQQPANLARNEFVIPADVVSHVGNGSSEAGAEQLYSMMDRIRQARTGTTQQGRQINPNNFMPG